MERQGSASKRRRKQLVKPTVMLLLLLVLLSLGSNVAGAKAKPKAAKQQKVRYIFGFRASFNRFFFVQLNI